MPRITLYPLGIVVPIPEQKAQSDAFLCNKTGVVTSLVVAQKDNIQYVALKVPVKNGDRLVLSRRHGQWQLVVNPATGDGFRDGRWKEITVNCDRCGGPVTGNIGVKRHGRCKKLGHHFSGH